MKYSQSIALAVCSDWIFESIFSDLSLIQGGKKDLLSLMFYGWLICE